MRKISLLGVAAIVLAAPASAADFGVYGTAGSAGLGGGFAVMLNSHLGARVGYTTFEYEVNDLEESDLTLDGEAEIGGVQALLDWHPFGGGFRLSIGAMESAKFSARARPIADTYTFDGVTYSAADIGEANGAAEFDSIAPYAGIGFGRALSANGRFSFAADLGVAFTGSADVTLNVSCRLSDPTLCAELEDDVAAEQAELQSEADKVEYWPVLSMGVSYRF